MGRRNVAKSSYKLWRKAIILNKLIVSKTNCSVIEAYGVNMRNLAFHNTRSTHKLKHMHIPRKLQCH
jgi:hypothetical protein